MLLGDRQADPGPSPELTGLLRGEQSDERHHDDEEQGDDGDQADLQRGPAGLLGRLGVMGVLRHLQISSVRRWLCQLTCHRSRGQGKKTKENEGLE